MTKFLSQASYDSEVLGFHRGACSRASWKNPQLGQPILGTIPLRTSLGGNTQFDTPQKARFEVPQKPQSPVKTIGTILAPVTPPKPHLYINNPYSFEHFTPPPPEEGQYRFGGQEELSPDALETDEHKIQQRLKQIGFGKSTKGYETYSTLVIKHLREIDNEDHPVTPRANQKCSKRSWDGQLKKWRRLLHRWDNVLPAGSGSSPLFAEFEGLESTDQEASEHRGSSVDALSLLDLCNDEPRTCSWASECSEAPQLEDDLELADGSELSDWQPMCQSL